MSAMVKPNPFGGWIAYCDECRETITGHARTVDAWADVHADYCTRTLK